MSKAYFYALSSAGTDPVEKQPLGQNGEPLFHVKNKLDGEQPENISVGQIITGN